MEFVETDRLIMRRWNEDDASALFKYAKDPAVGPAAGWHPHTSVEYSRGVINTYFSAPEVYAVIPKEVGEPVGCCGIMLSGGNHPDVIKNNDAEIGYWIGVPYWGCGFIPEAVDALLHRCFDELNLSAAWIAFYDGNDKSRRVAEKCGFKYQFTRDAELLSGDVGKEHLYKLTSDEYRCR